MPKFVRPQSAKFPQTYVSFKAKDKDSEDIVEYVIQDLPEDYYEVALDLLVKGLLPDETLHACRGIAGNADAVKEAREDWKSKIAQKVSIACFKSNGKDLVGVNVLGVVSKGDEPSTAGKSAEFKDIVGASEYISKKHDVFGTYGVDKYLTDFGLVIGRDYRQRGIAGEFLKGRIAVAKAFDLKVTSSTFTAIGSQKPALKAGYKEILSISFADIGKVFPNFDFSKATTEQAKILDYKV